MEETSSTSYLLSDHQDSKRLVMNSSGGVVARHDYYPFGESIQAGVGLRTVGKALVRQTGSGAGLREQKAMQGRD